MPKVDWNNPVAVWAAVARRRRIRRDSKKLGGVNVATFLWTDGAKTHATTRWSESPLGTKADHTLHSEEVIWSAIKATCQTIFWVFTERAPCPPAPVGRGCRVWLPEVLKVKGVKQGDTPIYWIYEYPDNTGLDFEDTQHDLAKVLPPGKTLTPVLASQASQFIRSWATQGLKGVDAAITEDYKAHGKGEGNTTKAQIHALKEQFAKNYAAVIDMP